MSNVKFMIEIPEHRMVELRKRFEFEWEITGDENIIQSLFLLDTTSEIIDIRDEVKVEKIKD